ncbi:MAG: hypothetical protein QOH71_2371 [Blastocatellia bacterium]|jgi:hypothetical protein|nr:hypothetical protein [Blastocatellia bacterium]
MTIKARAFTTKVGEVEVEGYFEDESFVFRFYGLVTFRPRLKSTGEDQFGKFAVLEETEISHEDGFALSVETNYDPESGSEWGYVLSFRRNDTGDHDRFRDLLKNKGMAPESGILITPPRQLTSVYFNPRGVMDGSAEVRLPEREVGAEEFQAVPILESVRSSATRRILFLPHAVRQMSRPERMITTAEVRNVVATGVVVENYLTDPRGASCLLLGWGLGGRPIHVVCSPKPDFLAIITAYLPDRYEWSDDFSVRISR